MEQRGGAVRDARARARSRHSNQDVGQGHTPASLDATSAHAARAAAAPLPLGLAGTRSDWTHWPLTTSLPGLICVAARRQVLDRFPPLFPSLPHRIHHPLSFLRRQTHSGLDRIHSLPPAQETNKKTPFPSRCSSLSQLSASLPSFRPRTLHRTALPRTPPPPTAQATPPRS